MLLHAHAFVRKVANRLGPKLVTLADRRTIFEETLRHLSTLPVNLLNVVLSVPRWGSRQKAHEIAVERLANRVQRMMRGLGSYAVVIFDRGKEDEITKIVRRLNVFNPIPSAYGAWNTGASTANLVLDRFIDDPIFKDSRRSYFLQLTDFAAWTLLKAEVPATGFVATMGYDTLFPILHAICFTRASRTDPLGIVRG